MSRRLSSPAPAAPLDDEDLLQEILLRLPPLPSSLPRASLVCKRWRRILSDSRFLSRFRKHHRKPPLLGFFAGCGGRRPVFTPVFDSPDRISPARFPVPWHHNPFDEWNFLGCRHGLAILMNQCRREVIIWDPLTGQHHRVPFPLGLYNSPWGSFCIWHATVLCADNKDGHVHGDCFSGPFKLVLLCSGVVHTLACIYESASCVWGDIISIASKDTIYHAKPNILVGNALCWLLRTGDILAFDFGRKSLSVIEKPTEAHIPYDCDGSVELLRTKDGGLGLAILLQLTIQLWERKSDCDAFVGWVLLLKTIQLEDLFLCTFQIDLITALIMGYDEDTNVIVLSTTFCDFMLQVDTMEIKLIRRNGTRYDSFYPYANFYTPGKGVGWKWLDLEL